MKDMVRSWQEREKSAKVKILLCLDGWEVKSCLSALRGAVSRDESYTPSVNDNRVNSSLVVHDSVFSLDFVVNAIPINQWSWIDKIRGFCYDEILVTADAASNGMYKEHIPGALQRKVCSKTVDSHALLFLAKNDQRVMNAIELDTVDWGTKDHRKPEIWSLSEDFDFPVSLFRRCMTNYFVNWKIPTREEFIFALTMEGISGSTDREKKAIEEAKFYLESQK